ncbi:hypothetical protein HanXRQr2_Chr04g0185761 [Helianthus annuus]|uniref:Uncharacterized protein n=1 Tax=Helianthus annuus TaxID=4232 RepID=A0A9K3JBD7_HELAN|nr:hypothetical protein HanXRQr2_Chr04g0185761 [Helianthus annuus]KAJ0590672.1 hypothetical protein HanIR_Chr04g0200091 [Helianthus annuus]
MQRHGKVNYKIMTSVTFIKQFPNLPLHVFKSSSIERKLYPIAILLPIIFFTILLFP